MTSWLLWQKKQQLEDTAKKKALYEEQKKQEAEEKERKRKEEAARVEMAGKVQAAPVLEKKQPDPANVVTQQPAISKVYREQAAKLRRKRVVIAITANETQFAYLNEVLMKLKGNAEKVEILESEEL